MKFSSPHVTRRAVDPKRLLPSRKSIGPLEIVPGGLDEGFSFCLLLFFKAELGSICAKTEYFSLEDKLLSVL